MNSKSLRRMVRQALREDVGTGDITTRLTVEAGSTCHAVLRAKADGVLSGMVPFRFAFDLMRAGIRSWETASDGDTFANGDVLARFTGKTRGVLTAERTALNFVRHLSGVATLTAAYVRAVEGLKARIADTRKTTPLFRDLEKRAVLHGGGTNHRYGLYDAILIKDNHIQAAGGIEEALLRAKAGTHHLMKIEIEVTNLEECKIAVEAGANVVMLDNMSLDEMDEAVRTWTDAPIEFEASGNVTLKNVRKVAETGVDIISVGALTHSAAASDLSLLIEED